MCIELHSRRDVLFSSITVESMPLFISLHCEEADKPRGAANSTRNNASYTGQLAQIDFTDESKPAGLTITLSEASGLAVSFSVRQLYE